MLELKAGAFVAAATALAATASYISGIGSVTETEGKLKIFHPESDLEEPDRAFLRSRWQPLSEHLDALGAEVTGLCLEDAKTRISQPWAKWEAAKAVFDEISSTLRRELSLKTVLVLQPQEALYYAPKRPLFGQDFANKFKTDGAFELDEAAKCLALGRPTAAAFHLMRIMEVGIRALARSLQIPDPVKPVERNWAVILKAVCAGIEAKWPTAASRISGDGSLFEDLHASLDAVKNPWRNATMHVEKKYTGDEAIHIFHAVSGFMMKLSSRMDEDGLPLA
jgi:hypothetical protein